MLYAFKFLDSGADSVTWHSLKAAQTPRVRELAEGMTEVAIDSARRAERQFAVADNSAY